LLEDEVRRSAANSACRKSSSGGIRFHLELEICFPGEITPEKLDILRNAA
jgi:hypothetical protein